MTPWMHLHKSDQPRRANGIQPLWLDLYEGDKRVIRLTVNSGQGWAQVFRTGADSRAGSYEPIPEGRYLVYGTEWAGGRGNWTSVWSAALGPFVNVIDNDEGFYTERSELRLHMDWNLSGAPGTAGCIGFESREDGQTWLDWRSKFAGAIKLIVDWGLETVRLVSAGAPPKPPVTRPVKAYLTEGRTIALVDGQKVPDLELRFKRGADGSWHYWRNGVEQRAAWTRIEVGEL